MSIPMKMHDFVVEVIEGEWYAGGQPITFERARRYWTEDWDCSQHLGVLYWGFNARKEMTRIDNETAKLPTVGNLPQTSPTSNTMSQNTTALQSYSIADLADQIHEDYATAMNGMRAYITMGIRLHTVKSSLPHGSFLAWCAKNLRIQKRHIANAMRIADGICTIADVQMCNALHICETPGNAIFELIDGHSHRSLLSTIQTYRQDPTEEASRLWCEERWAKNPGDRDDWEPRVLSGEITYIFAKIGMLGIETSKGQTRPDPAYEKLLARNAGSYTQIWEKWETLPEPVRHEGIAKLQDAFTGAPDEVKRSLLRALQTPAAIPA